MSIHHQDHLYQMAEEPELIVTPLAASGLADFVYPDASMMMMSDDDGSETDYDADTILLDSEDMANMDLAAAAADTNNDNSDDDDEADDEVDNDDDDESAAADTADDDEVVEINGGDDDDAADDDDDGPVTLNLFERSWVDPITGEVSYRSMPTNRSHLDLLENLNWKLIHQSMDDQLATMNMAIDAARDSLQYVAFLLKYNGPLLRSVETNAAQSERELIKLIPAVYASAPASQLERVEAWARAHVRRQ
jgi:hypothetical protein